MLREEQEKTSNVFQGHGDLSVTDGDFPEGIALETVGFACGKVILVGEHAVVYGARAIAMPVPTMRMAMRVSSRANQKGENVVEMRLSGSQVSDQVLAVAREGLDLLGIKGQSVRIDGTSNLWIGAGLGSSASLCVGLLRTFARHWSLDISRRKLAALANQLEARFHGRPSGLDAAVVALEQVISFCKSSGPLEFSFPAGNPFVWSFAILDTKTRSSTKAMVDKAAPWFSRPEGDSAIARFDSLAQWALQSLSCGTYEELAEIMRETHTHLRHAGVVTSTCDEVVKIASQAGALAAKVTGAGGGGTILALLNPKQDFSQQILQLQVRLGAGRVLGMRIGASFPSESVEVKS